jgi:hypothetical protein
MTAKVIPFDGRQVFHVCGICGLLHATAWDGNCEEWRAALTNPSLLDFYLGLLDRALRVKEQKGSKS